MRREFLKRCGLAALGAAAPAGLASVRADELPRRRRVTLAQILVGSVVAENLKRMTTAIVQAKRDRADWVFFPEGALSGYHDRFKQEEVAEAFQELCRLCKDANLVGLIGTCWQERAGAKPYNQIRIVDRAGELIGRYSKTCLTYSDAKQFASGNHPLVHRVDGLIVGTLICNDLWVTPGYSDGPNPHLSLKQAKAGAQVIFHAVNSGGNRQYRAYHESNQAVRAAEAKCPIVTVNAAVANGEVNCTSGVVLPSLEYAAALPRQGEQIETVEFAPRAK